MSRSERGACLTAHLCRRGRAPMHDLGRARQDLIDVLFTEAPRVLLRLPLPLLLEHVIGAMPQEGLEFLLAATQDHAPQSAVLGRATGVKKGARAYLSLGGPVVVVLVLALAEAPVCCSKPCRTA